MKPKIEVPVVELPPGLSDAVRGALSPADVAHEAGEAMVAGFVAGLSAASLDAVRGAALGIESPYQRPPSEREMAEIMKIPGVRRGAK